MRIIPLPVHAKYDVHAAADARAQLLDKYDAPAHTQRVVTFRRLMSIIIHLLRDITAFG